MNKIPANVAPPAGPCCLVIFGASGDLTHRLLVPALYNLAAGGLLPDASAPALTTRAAVYAGHVLGHGRLSDRKSELEQLAMNARCTPKRILDAHSTDQRP